MVDSDVPCGVMCAWGAWKHRTASRTRRGRRTVLACERSCSRLQPLQGQRVRVSQVNTVELTLMPEVRFPGGTPGAQHALARRKGASHDQQR